LHLEIHCSTRDGWTVLTPFGDLDMAGAPGFRQAVVRRSAKVATSSSSTCRLSPFSIRQVWEPSSVGYNALEPMAATWSSYVPTPNSGEPSSCAISTEFSTSTLT